MSVNIGNLDKSIINAALLKKGKPTVTAAKTPMNEAMSKNGSVFNLINTNKEAQKANPKSDLANFNAFKSIEELNNNKKGTAAKSTSNNGGEVKNASEGKAKAAAMETKASSLQSQTKNMQAYDASIKSFTSEAQNLDKQTKTDEKTFSAEFKAEQYELKKANADLAKALQQQQEDQQQVDDAQRQLDSLMARSSFSIGRDNGTSSSGDDAKIQELQQFIGSKVSGMQQNGRTIYSLQRTQSRSINKLNQSNAKFIKAQQVSTKAMEQKESTADKVLKVATTVEQISQLVTTGGQVLKTLGTAMIAAGSTPFTAWMVPVGTVMAKVGAVAEMVGNYGSAAANVTKTGVYAAQGNIQGAIQSAASAAMTGAAAVKQTTNLKSEFGSINAQAKDVNITREANAEAKTQVNNARTDAAKELAKEKGIDISGMSEKDIEKAVGGKDAVNAKAFGTDKNNNPISAKQARKATSAAIQNDMRNAKSGDANYVASRHNAYSQGKDVRANIAKNQREIKDENGVIKNQSALSTAKKGGFTNVVDNSLKKSSSSFDFKKLSGLGSMAAGLNQDSYSTNPLGNNYSTKSSKSKNNKEGQVTGMSSAYAKIAQRRKARRS